MTALRVEQLGFVAHVGHRIRFSYPSPDGGWVSVEGMLKHITTAAGGVTLMVDGTYHLVPLGTQVTVEARDSR